MLLVGTSNKQNKRTMTTTLCGPCGHQHISSAHNGTNTAHKTHTNKHKQTCTHVDSSTAHGVCDSLQSSSQHTRLSGAINIHTNKQTQGRLGGMLLYTHKALTATGCDSGRGVVCCRVEAAVTTGMLLPAVGATVSDWCCCCCCCSSLCFTCLLRAQQPPPTTTPYDVNQM